MHSLIKQEPTPNWIVTYMMFLFLFPQKAQSLPQSELNTQTVGLIEDYFKWTGIWEAIFLWDIILFWKYYFSIIQQTFPNLQVIYLASHYIFTGLHDLKGHTINAAVMRGNVYTINLIMLEECHRQRLMNSCTPTHAIFELIT